MRLPDPTLARLIGGHVCLHACMTGLRLAAPLLALRQGHSPLAVGGLMALFALTQVFLALPAGRYADRHGLRRPLARSVVVASAGALLALVWPVFPVLLLAALMTGGATGTALIALQRHVGRLAGDATRLKQVFSWLALGPALSNVLGPLLAGLLIDHAGAWLAGPGPLQPRAGFAAAFVVLAALPWLGWALVRRTPELAPVATPAQAGPARAWDLLRQPALRRLLLVNWCVSASWDVHTFVLPVLGHERGLSASAIGAILGAFAAAAVAVRLCLPLLAARLREPVVLGTAMALTAVVFGVYPLLQAPLAMAACSVLLGLALGSVQPMVMSLLHQFTPAHRHGEALGLRLMAMNASSVAMPLLFGSAGALVGVAVVFWCVGGAVALVSRVAWGLPVSSAEGGTGSTG